MLEDAPAGGGLDAHDGQIVTDAVVQVTGDTDPVGLALGLGQGHLEAVTGGRAQQPGRQVRGQCPQRCGRDQRHDRAQQSESDRRDSSELAGGDGQDGIGPGAPHRVQDQDDRGGQQHRQTARGDQPQQQVHLHPGHVLEAMDETGAAWDHQLRLDAEHGTGRGDLQLPHPGHQAEQPTEQHGPCDADAQHRGRGAVVRAHRDPQAQHEHDGGADRRADHQPREPASVPSDVHASILAETVGPGRGAVVDRR